MKHVRRTKEPSLNQMAIMVANLKEMFGREAALNIDVASYDPIRFGFYQGPIAPNSNDGWIKYRKTWKEFQDLYFEVIGGN